MESDFPSFSRGFSWSLSSSCSRSAAMENGMVVNHWLDRITRVWWWVYFCPSPSLIAVCCWSASKKTERAYVSAADHSCSPLWLWAVPLDCRRPIIRTICAELLCSEEGRDKNSQNDYGHFKSQNLRQSLVDYDVKVHHIDSLWHHNAHNWSPPELILAGRLNFIFIKQVIEEATGFNLSATLNLPPEASLTLTDVLRWV